MNQPPFSPDVSVSILPLGELLVQAGLLSQAQLDFILYEQESQHASVSLGQRLMLGELLVLRGWLSPMTVDFFSVFWFQVVQECPRRRLGEYLLEAGLLQGDQLQSLLREQQSNRMRLGALAVLKGWLDPRTLDFLLTHLYPEEKPHGPWMKTHSLAALGRTLKPAKSQTRPGWLGWWKP